MFPSNTLTTIWLPFKMSETEQKREIKEHQLSTTSYRLMAIIFSDMHFMPSKEKNCRPKKERKLKKKHIIRKLE